MATRWSDPLFEPVDGASLAVFRVVLGLSVAIGAVRYVAYGWVDLLYLRPTFFFTWPGFDWVHPWPGLGMYVLYGLLATFAAWFALGLYTRVAAVGLFATFVYIELIDKTNYLNHYYLVSLLLFLGCFLPVSRTGSLDARRLRSGCDAVPTWVLWLLRGQLGLVYFFAGVAKLDAGWLLRGEPLDIWLATKTDFPVVGPLLDDHQVALGMSWGGALFDLSVPFLLASRRTRAVGYALVLGFHLATGLLFNIGVLPVIMVGLTPIFFEPDWPRRVLAQVGVVSTPLGHTTPFGARRGVVLAALAAWFTVQIALPLRHFAYPGDVLWTQEGFRFSWRFLLVENRGFFKYRVVDPATGQRWVVRPEDWLDARQRHVASSSPDLILHLAHAIAEEWARQGHPGVAVYADAWVSRNGSPSVRFLDPDRDLAKVSRYGLARWDWVLPPD